MPQIIVGLNDPKATERAELAAQKRQQASTNAWAQTVHKYTHVTHPEFADPIRYGALDAAFAQIAATEEGKKLTGTQLLDRARERVEFAELDRLLDADYAAFEDKMMNMSDAQRDTYVAGCQ